MTARRLPSDLSSRLSRFSTLMLCLCLFSTSHGGTEVEEEVKDASLQKDMVKTEARQWRETSDELDDMLLGAYNARLLINDTLAWLDTCALDEVMSEPPPLCAAGLCRQPGVSRDPTVYADKDEVSFATHNTKRNELCPARSGDFRHPTDRQKFYRCREHFHTVEHCGTGFFFDPAERFCRPVATATSSTEDMAALLPNETDPSSTNGSTASMLGTAGWRCAEDRLPSGDDHQWDLSRDGVAGCWREAVRRRSAQLAVGPSGCLYGNLSGRVTAAACSERVLHVIDVQPHQRQLDQLRPGANHWITGRDPDGIQWQPLGTATANTTLRACADGCLSRGADFSLVDGRGCRCGLAAGPADITNSAPSWAGRPLPAVSPAVVLSLTLNLPAAAACRPGAASVTEDPAAIQETTDYCQRRQRQANGTAAERPTFHCSASNVGRLFRARRSQCEMAAATNTHSCTVDWFRLNSHRRVNVKRASQASDFRLFWIAESPREVKWISTGYFLTPDECLQNCSQRFTLIGENSCLCGSLVAQNTSWNVLNWLASQNNLTVSRGQGFLLHDKATLADAPEGWSCSTKPTAWKEHPDAKDFAACINVCNETASAFAAFGKSGCYCGNSTNSSRLQFLPMESCQTTSNSTEAYSVLSVNVWMRNLLSLQKRKDYSASLVAAPPAGVQWKLEPGRTTLLDCFWTCNARTGVTFILIGVSGCQCGTSIPGSTRKPPPPWRLDNERLAPSQGFLLISRTKPSVGTKHTAFEWQHRVQPGVLTNTTYDNVSQAWVPDSSASNANPLGNGPRNLTFNGESTDSQEKHRQLVVSVTKNKVATSTTGRSNAVISKTFLTGPDKHLIKETASQNVTFNTASSYDGEPKYLAGKRESRHRNLVHAKVKVDDTGIGSHEARGHMLDLHATRRRQWSEEDGVPLVVRPVVDGTCYQGPANKTAWATAAPTTDSASALQCLCLCMQKERLLVAVVESGACLCAPGASQLGNATAQVTRVTDCPAGTARAAFSVSRHIRPLMRYCRHEQPIGKRRLQIGEAGDYSYTKLSVFENAGMSRFTSSENNIAAMHTGRSVFSRTAAVLMVHEKNGTLATTRECSLRKGPTGRDFSLEVLETYTADYDERFEFLKKDTSKKRNYKRVSIFQ